MPAASAQQDPYSGGTPTTTTSTTTTQPGTGGGGGGGTASTTVEARPSEGPPGTVVTVRACGYTPGETVNFTFDGQPVGSGVAGADGCAEATFTVPNIRAGTYQLCALSAGRAAACRDFRVLAAATGAGPLARTGVAIAALVVVGLLAIAVGLALRAASRRRLAAARR